MRLNTSNPFRLAALYGRLSRLVREFRPDVVDCHRGESFFLWGLLKLAGARFALVRTRGDQRPPRASSVNRWLHARVADAVVVTNSRMRRHFLEVMRTPPERLHLVLGGVDRERFCFDAPGRERVRAEFGYTDTECVLGLLGRFDAVKGQRETIRAVAELYHRDGVRNIRLLLIGFPTSTAQAEVEGWIRENNVADITRITGERDDVTACISALDLGLVTSLGSETIARAALEIMSCGIPLLGSDVGVMPDLLEPDALFAPASSEALAGSVRAHLTPQARDGLLQVQAQRISGLDGRDFLAQSLDVFRQARVNAGLSV